MNKSNYLDYLDKNKELSRRHYIDDVGERLHGIISNDINKFRYILFDNEDDEESRHIHSCELMSRNDKDNYRLTPQSIIIQYNYFEGGRAVELVAHHPSISDFIDQIFEIKLTYEKNNKTIKKNKWFI